MDHNSPVKTRDLPITVLRLPPELRAALTREAHINRTSLNAEAIRRLSQSIQQTATPSSLNTASGPVAGPSVSDAKPSVTSLNEHERLLLNLFASMTPERQLALLTVLRK